LFSPGVDKPCALAACRQEEFEAIAPLLKQRIALVHAEILDEALVILEHVVRIDLILASVGFDDAQMLELLRTAKAERPDIPFVACVTEHSELDGHSLSEMRAESLALGAVEFIDLQDIAARYGEERLGEKLLALILRHVRVSPP
jgi:CheY-like chemotaxis protein